MISHHEDKYYFGVWSLLTKDQVYNEEEEHLCSLLVPICVCIAAVVVMIIVMNDQCLEQSLSCGLEIFHHHRYQEYLSSSHLVISIPESYSQV